MGLRVLYWNAWGKGEMAIAVFRRHDPLLQTIARSLSHTISLAGIALAYRVTSYAMKVPVPPSRITDDLQQPPSNTFIFPGVL